MIMNLSEHFTLNELTRSAVAARRGIDNSLRYSTDAWIIGNLETLCRTVLEPIRHYVGAPIRVNSGYRCALLNALLGGSDNSQHKTGNAADITWENFDKNCLEVVFKVACNLSHLPIDQLILYDTFIHVSCSSFPRHIFLDYRS